MDRNGFGRRGRSERNRDIRKGVAATALAVIFGCVVFSMPAEQLAWQSSYVMGALLLPEPSPASNPLAVASSADIRSGFGLLGFLSVLGILGLARCRILPEPRMVRVRLLPQRDRLGPHEGLLIHYRVKPLP